MELSLVELSTCHLKNVKIWQKKLRMASLCGKCESENIYIYIFFYIFCLAQSQLGQVCFYNTFIMIRSQTAVLQRLRIQDMNKFTLMSWHCHPLVVLMVTHEETASFFTKMCKVSRKNQCSLLYIKDRKHQLKITITRFLS